MERLLAAGGMGAVYVVDQLSTGKKRALKVMHRNLVDDADSRRRFLQEARIGSLIASEHVVEVHQAGIDPGTGSPFLVMELLEGEDLAARLARGPIPALEVSVILGQLCHALAAAHDAGVVHRDLKPANVFLSVRRRAGASSGSAGATGVPGASVTEVKVLDFGIAKLTEGRNTTVASGTPMWLAPEQTQRGHVTPAADVWALGLVAFQMLSGRGFWKTPEMPQASLVDLLSEITRLPIPPASTRAADVGARVPRDFDAWFARCLARDPAERYPNARACFAALEPILAGAASPISAPMAPPLGPVGPSPLAYSAADLGAAPRLGPPVAPPIAPPPGPMPLAATSPALGPPPPPLMPPVAPPAAPRSRAGLWIAVAASTVVLLIGAVLAIGWYSLRASGPRSWPEGAPPSPAPRTGPSLRSGSPPLTIVVQGDNPTVQAAMEQQVHGALAPKIEDCVRGVSAGSSVMVTLQVTPDGRTGVLQTIGNPSGPHALCVSELLRHVSLPAQKRATAVSVVIMAM